MQSKRFRTTFSKTEKPSQLPSRKNVTVTSPTNSLQATPVPTNPPEDNSPATESIPKAIETRRAIPRPILHASKSNPASFASISSMVPNKNTTKSSSNLQPRVAHQKSNLPIYMRRPNRHILEKQLAEKQRKYASSKKTLENAQHNFDEHHCKLNQFQTTLKGSDWLDKLMDLSADSKVLPELQISVQEYNNKTTSNADMQTDDATVCSTNFKKHLQLAFSKAYAGIRSEVDGHELEAKCDKFLQKLEFEVMQLLLKHVSDGKLESIEEGSTLDIQPISDKVETGTSTDADVTDDCKSYSPCDRYHKIVDHMLVIQKMSHTQVCLLKDRMLNYESLCRQTEPHRIDRTTSTANVRDPIKQTAKTTHDNPNTNVDVVEVVAADSAQQKRTLDVLELLLNKTNKQLCNKRTACKLMRRKLEDAITANANIIRENRQLRRRSIAQNAQVTQLQLHVNELQANCAQHSRSIAVHKRILRVRCELLDLIKSKCQSRRCSLAELYADIEQSGDVSPSLKQLRFEMSARSEDIRNLFSTLSDKQRDLLKLRQIIRSLEESQQSGQRMRELQVIRIVLLEKQIAELQEQLRGNGGVGDRDKCRSALPVGYFRYSARKRWLK